MVARLRPDLLLLDIQLPSGTGFDLLEGLDPMPLVVFTTAYDQYALRACEANALDYLVKPVVRGRLAAALDRVRARLAAVGARVDDARGRWGAEGQAFLGAGERGGVV